MYLRQHELDNWFIHQAILGVGEVLQFYDTDRRFPAWGFGAKTQGHVSHCFNLNTATNDCEVRFMSAEHIFGLYWAFFLCYFTSIKLSTNIWICNSIVCIISRSLMSRSCLWTQVVGVEGIMSAYTSSLYSVSLAGPTMFGPVINKAAEIATQSLQYSNNKYFVLLIITVCNKILCLTSVGQCYLTEHFCRMGFWLIFKKQKIALWGHQTCHCRFSLSALVMLISNKWR